MFALMVIAIVLGSILSYMVIGAISWAVQVRVFQMPPRTGSSYLDGTNGMDREDASWLSAFWPFTVPALLFYYITKYIALKILNMFEMQSKKVRSKEEPVTCDVCRGKFMKGPHR